MTHPQPPRPMTDESSPRTPGYPAEREGLREQIAFELACHAAGPGPDEHARVKACRADYAAADRILALAAPSGEPEAIDELRKRIVDELSTLSAERRMRPDQGLPIQNVHQIADRLLPLYAGAAPAKHEALRRETDWLVRTIEAHDLMPYTCDRDGAESCDCIDRQLDRVREMLNPERAD